MRIYHYDQKTGEFMGWGEADPDPLENPNNITNGKFLIPAHATTEPPPTLIKGNVVVWRDGKWGYLLPDDPDGVPSDTPIPPPDPPALPKGEEAIPQNPAKVALDGIRPDQPQPEAPAPDSDDEPPAAA